MVAQVEIYIAKTFGLNAMFSFKLANLCSIAKKVIYIRWVRIIYIAKIKNEKLFDIHILFMIKCFIFKISTVTVYVYA